MTKRPLRAYWWRGGPRYGNFGDLLTPLLLEHLAARPIEHSSPDRADIIAIGSVLEPSFWTPGSWSDFGGFIWGAGRLGGSEPMDLPAAQVTALRGKRTLQSLGCRAKDSIQLGDPGLLAGLLTEKKPSRYKLGIILHWSEFLQPALAPLVAMSPEILLIDPCAGAGEVLNCSTFCGSDQHRRLALRAFRQSTTLL